MWAVLFFSFLSFLSLVLCNLLCFGSSQESQLKCIVWAQLITELHAETTRSFNRVAADNAKKSASASKLRATPSNSNNGHLITYRRKRMTYEPLSII